MAQNLYREWFVKFRFPAHEKARFVDSPLGSIPEGWEFVNFGELYITSSGGTPSRKVAEYYGGSHPWVKTRELNDGFILETEETITSLGLTKSSAKLFPENTVILAIYGATIGKLGILSIPSATNQACVAILPKEVGFGRAFAFQFLRENKDKLIGLGQGAAQQNISQVVLKNFPAIRPPVNLMQEFSVMVEPLLDNVRNMQQKNITLRRTRDLLLPKLISGEVDVSELDITIPEEAV
jgi:type I restriction enzyme S subunit